MSSSPLSSPNQDSMRGMTEAIPLALSASEIVTGRKKIVVVDDSLVVRKVLAMKLKANGYDVLEAADGATALSIVRSSRPDLMLLDISFPADVAQGGGASWDGFHIMEWLRRMEEAKDMPIIVITGGNADEYRPRSFKAGAVGFFSKPINQEELLAVIRRTVGEDQLSIPPQAA